MSDEVLVRNDKTHFSIGTIITAEMSSPMSMSISRKNVQLIAISVFNHKIID